MNEEGEQAAPPGRRLAGLAGGGVLFAAMLAAPPPEGLAPEAWSVAATAALMVVLWVTEALPLPATALIPVAVLPLLGVTDMASAAAPYANPLIFLFLGGFLIAKGIEASGLHRRLALTVIRLFGTRPAALVGGFMAATAALSMWLSNTATAVMMLPIGLSVIALFDTAGGIDQRRRFAVAVLLGIAYGASIGGIGTLIGTPPNALLAAYLAEAHGIQVGFARWMLVGVPVALLMLVLAWLYLVRVALRLPATALPGAAALIAAEARRLGPLRSEETRVGAVFLLVAAAWVAQPWLAAALPGAGLSDSAIAILGGLALFAIPADLRRGRFLLDWRQAKTLPWGVLVLFGGGLSLAAAIETSGLAAAIGDLLGGAAGWPTVLIVLLVAGTVVFITEIASNTAAASIFIPLAATLGSVVGVGPASLAVPAAIAASCAFMMPVATPPNAVVFGSGHLRVADMARAGFVLNLLAIAVTVAGAHVFARVLTAG